MGKLTDTQQGLLMFFVFILPPLITWTALGYPTDRTSLGILGSSMFSGILALVKEILGYKPKEG